MRKLLLSHLLLLCALVPMNANATTFFPSKETCPICDRQTSTTMIGSYGGYIYQWDSKYDLVYWPFDGPAMFWYCPNCGYDQISRYFLDLTETEKSNVREYLAKNFVRGEKLSFADEMKRTKAIALARGMKRDDLAWLNRVLIYNFREIDPAMAKDLAREEIGLLQDGYGELQGDPKTRHYLIGEYHRFLGDDQLARQYLRQSISEDVAASVFMVFLLLLAGGVTLSGALAIIHIKRKFTPPKRKNATVLIAAAILILAVGAMFAYHNYYSRRPENEYFTKIAENRLALLDNPEKAQAASETQP